jgi:hypothetical protein
VHGVSSDILSVPYLGIRWSVAVITAIAGAGAVAGAARGARSVPLPAVITSVITSVIPAVVTAVVPAVVTAVVPTVWSGHGIQSHRSSAANDLLGSTRSNSKTMKRTTVVTVVTSAAVVAATVVAAAAAASAAVASAAVASAAVLVVVTRSRGSAAKARIAAGEVVDTALITRPITRLYFGATAAARHLDLDIVAFQVPAARAAISIHGRSSPLAHVAALTCCPSL